jgi:hypothetical protein
LAMLTYVSHANRALKLKLRERPREKISRVMVV